MVTTATGWMMLCAVAVEAPVDVVEVIKLPDAVVPRKAFGPVPSVKTFSFVGLIW